MKLDEAVEVLLDAIADRIADRVAAKLQFGTSVHGMQSQHGSPLGRRHNASVRRRLARGEPGAFIVGRAHYLTPDALREEMGMPRDKEPGRIAWTPRATSRRAS